MNNKPAGSGGFFYCIPDIQKLRHSRSVDLSGQDNQWPRKDRVRWPYFTATEMACRHCGEGYDWPEFMSRLVAARRDVGRPFHILSAHRCALHNARVGGAPRSQHLRLAVDIATHNHNREDLFPALRRAGFTGFGFYTTFIHADLGRRRHWFGSKGAKQLWPHSVLSQ